MTIRLLEYDVDFTRLCMQRHASSLPYHPRPGLAWWAAVGQALAALLPGPRSVAWVIQEGLSRDQISCDRTRRTGRYSYARLRTLFIVPGCYTPEPDARSRLWMLRGLGWRAGWRVVVALWRDYQDSATLRELIYRAIPYAVLFEAVRPTFYLTTNTAQFPESPAVVMANAMGVKTILWHYGAQHVLPTTTKPERWEVPAAMWPAVSEIRVWSEWAKGLWLANAKVPPPRLVVDGPRMLGDKPASFPPSQCIGVADTCAKCPPYGIVTAAWVDAFYADLGRLFRRHRLQPVLVKPKYDGPTVAPCTPRDALCQLANVWTMAADDNPWTLIARCGLLICLPFSSMGVAALAVGRQVIFYDPTGTARFYPDPSLFAHYVEGMTALAERLEQWVALTQPAEGSTLMRHGGRS